MKKTKRKIDVVVKYFYPLWAGIEVNVANVYGFMVKEGWDVDLHTTTDMPDAPNSLAKEAIFRGIKVHRYEWNWWGYLPRIDWGNSDALALHNFDIFPHSWILTYILVRRLLGLKTPKVFLTPHGGFTIATGWHTYPFWQRVIKKTYQNTIGLFLINNVVDGFRSVSAWEAEEAIKSGLKPEIVKVITNGLEDEAYLNIEKLASPKIKKIVKELGTYVLQIGRIHPIKNQATVIKAMVHTPKEVKFAMVGPVTNFEYEKELKDLINKLGLSSRVKFLGIVSGIDKYYVLKHCLSYTHMSTWESYCNTVHESMSQGCIPIVSKDTALEELVKDKVSGFVVPVFDDLGIAEKITYILKNTNSKVLRTIKKNALAYTKGHSWRAISQKVSDMYLSYLN